MSENLVSLLKQSRQQFAHSPLFGKRDGQSWRWISYLQFDQRVERAAAHLARLGVGRGDRVAIVGDWCVEWAEVAHAACRRRASFVLVPTRLSLTEWLSIFRDCGAKLAFATERLHYDALETSRFESAGVERVIGLSLPAEHPDSYSRWLADAPSTAPEERTPNPDDIASRIYARSDGERPKGVGLSHRTLCQASASICQPSHCVRRTVGGILSLRGLFASAAA
ncbi:MAG TPA: class I adenylate-forming enzyme family protein [Polyangiaceae bacterium]|nr:class I adenylate-forming enzyme family protein [Polyangiaceae bacterium]